MHLVTSLCFRASNYFYLLFTKSIEPIVCIYDVESRHVEIATSKEVVANVGMWYSTETNVGSI
jgi:hypothetical protein